MKRIFMTGAGGFLGSKICRHLQADNSASVIPVGESFKGCARTTAAALSHLGPYDKDSLVLCGASYYKGNDPVHIAFMRAYNYDYTKMVIDQFVNNCGRRIIFFSSYMQLYATDAEPYADQYLQTKREILDYLVADPKLCVLNLYIYDNWAIGDARSKFVPMLLRTLREEREFNVPAPDTLIDLCDANSLTSTIASMCLSFEEGNVCLATGIPLTLREVAQIFTRELRLKGRINFGFDAPRHSFMPYGYLASSAIPLAKPVG